MYYTKYTCTLCMCMMALGYVYLCSSVNTRTLYSQAYFAHAFLFLSQLPVTDSNDLIDLLDMQDLSHSDIDEGDLYPSLLELSMDHNSPVLGSPCEDMVPITVSCNESGDFGIVLRHFTVLANIPVSCCCVV